MPSEPRITNEQDNGARGSSNRAVLSHNYNAIIWIFTISHTTTEFEIRFEARREPDACWFKTNLSTTKNFQTFFSGWKLKMLFYDFYNPIIKK